ncbi:MAG: hypothetical protein MUP70_13335 [Candidatus Aminicenantes bacterium]|nr:hypothetical protein [Candidatus Aminicenantes bacterium]
MMKEDDRIPEFLLLGGPLYRLGRRLGLVRGGTNTFRMGVSLGLSAWGILMLLALLQGFGHKAISLAVIGIHVRLLVGIPLFFLCETWVAPRMAEFVREIVHCGLVPDAALSNLTSDIQRLGRMKDSWLAETLFILLAFALPLIEPLVGLPGRTGNWETILNQAEGGLTWIHGWWLGFCLPLFRFLLFRWFWRLGLWWHFLWRLGKIDLHLIPTHPDHAGGLGYLEIVQEQFAPLAFAGSAICSASFTENIISGRMAFESLLLLTPLLLILFLALFIGPLFIFSSKLWICRITGWSEYMRMAYHYVEAFDRKWILNENVTGEAELGTLDLQSLADLTNSVNVVRCMRWIPAGRRLVVGLTAAVLLPLLLLVFLKFPVDQLAAGLFRILTGL